MKKGKERRRKEEEGRKVREKGRRTSSRKIKEIGNMKYIAIEEER